MVILEVKIYILFGSEISEQKLYSVESKGNTIREFPGDGSFFVLVGAGEGKQGGVSLPQFI